MRGVSRLTILVAALALGALLYVAVLVATDPRDNVTLVEAGLKVGHSGRRFATGTFRNNTDQSYSHVEVDIEFLRQDGTVAGRTAANTTNLGPGLTWKFELPLLGENAVRFRLTKLTCRRTAGDRDPPEGQKPVCALGRPVDVPEPSS
jgi:hypothetical protein